MFLPPIELLTNPLNASEKLASDNEYSARIRNVEAKTPARFNADTRRLNGASGCAGKVVVFAVRLDTYPVPKDNQVFYLGTNNPHILGKIRKHILSSFKNLPVSGEYLHKDCYDAAKKYSKDTFIAIEKLGPSFIPKLFEFKRKVDLLSQKYIFLPNKLSDKLMQFLSKLWPNHLPRRMEQYRDRYEHHWIIEISDDGIEEARSYFMEFFKTNKNANIRGIEISKEKVQICIAKGLTVIEGNAEFDLKQFPNDSFEYVVLGQTLQAFINPETVIRELLRVGNKAIVTIPNFGHWKVRLNLLFKGTMPITNSLPHDWYNTPNIHMCTIKDFVRFSKIINFKIFKSLALINQNVSDINKSNLIFKNLFGELGIFLIEK